MIKCIRHLSLASGVLLCAFAAIEPSAAQVRTQHAAKSNNVTTVVTPAAPPSTSTSTSTLTDLQQRKQQSIHDLNKRAEDLVHAWKLRQVRQAIADIKAQQEKDAQIAAAAAAKEAADAAAKEEAARALAARVEALRKQQLTPPTLTVPTLLQPTPVQTAEVAPPESSEGSIASVAPNPVAPIQPIPPLQITPPEDISTQEAVVSDTAATFNPTLNPTGDNESNVDLNAVAAVDGPIDRMALASSLFATESYKECLSILKAVDQKSISTENRDWCDFLAASCYRKLNDLPEAESRYRSLLGRTEVSWLANATRWWLDHLNEQQKLRGDLQQLRTNFTAWQEELDAIRNPD